MAENNPGNKERPRIRNRKYGQVQDKHAKKGIQSCVIAGSVLAVLIAMLGIAYASEGNAAAMMGAWGIAVLIFSGIGLNVGIKGMQEREKNYITCKIGIVCNAIFILLFLAIFIRGLI